MVPLALRIAYSFAYVLFLLPFHLVMRGRLARNSLSKLDRIMGGIRKGAIAHRGGTPENTINAFRKSKKLGATAVEVDLQITKDGHPVLFHDDTVDKLCNGSGELKNMTLDHVKTLSITGYANADILTSFMMHDAWQLTPDPPLLVKPYIHLWLNDEHGGSWHHAHTKIPTLYEAIDVVIKEQDMYMLLEIKDSSSKIINIVTELFKSDPILYEKIVVISFLPHILYKIKRIDPDIIVGFCIMQTIFMDEFDTFFSVRSKWRINMLKFFDSILAKLLIGCFRKILAVSLILPDKDDILENRINLEQFKNEGTSLITWTVNSEEEKDYFSNVLKIPIMTDNVP